MKRNEKLLVYGVTGFLAVIVLVAILFGEGPGVESRERAEKTPAGTPSDDGVERLNLDDLLARNAGPGAGPGGETGEGDAPEGDGSAGGSPGGMGRDSYALNSAPVAPAEQVARLLGSSEVEHGYRRVTIRRGDGLSNVVHRWCPGVENASQLVRVLNENLVGENPPLRVGDTLLVPLVTAEELLTAWETRGPEGGTPVPASMDSGSPSSGYPSAGSSPAAGDSLMTTATPPAQPGSTPGAPAGSTNPAATDSSAPALPATYKVVSGDNAWKIASKLGLPNNKIPAFIEGLKKANPNVTNIDALKLNQTLNLPR